MTTVLVHAISDSASEDVALSYEITQESAEITVTGPWGTVTGQAHDGFAALEEVRLQLDQHGWRLAVAGARRNVICVGATRGMTRGTTVTRLLPGGGMEKLGLFDPIDPVQVASVDEQRQQLMVLNQRPKSSAEGSGTGG